MFKIPEFNTADECLSEKINALWEIPSANASNCLGMALYLKGVINHPTLLQYEGLKWRSKQYIFGLKIGIDNCLVRDIALWLKPDKQHIGIKSFSVVASFWRGLIHKSTHNN